MIFCGQTLSPSLVPGIVSLDSYDPFKPRTMDTVQYLCRTPAQSYIEAVCVPSSLPVTVAVTVTMEGYGDGDGPSTGCRSCHSSCSFGTCTTRPSVARSGPTGAATWLVDGAGRTAGVRLAETADSTATPHRVARRAHEPDARAAAAAR